MLNQNVNAPKAGMPIVMMSHEVWQTIMAYVRACPVEINGFGMVSMIHQGNIYVRDVFILEQEATATHVATNDAALAAFLDRHLANGGHPGEIRFQWHSHVDMPARFSATDIALIQRWPGDWLVSLVVNKRGEYSCRIDMQSGGERFPLRVSVDTKITLVDVITEDAAARVAAEIAANVRISKPRVRRSKQVQPDTIKAVSQPLYYDPDDYLFLEG